MGKIIKVSDKNGNIQYPITIANAVVIDDNGTKKVLNQFLGTVASKNVGSKQGNVVTLGATLINNDLDCPALIQSDGSIVPDSRGSLGTAAFVDANTLATKTELNNLLGTADALTYKGVLTVNTTSGNTQNVYTPAANKGDVYKIVKTGSGIAQINGVVVTNGDMIICNTDNTAAANSSNATSVKLNWDYIERHDLESVSGPTSAVEGHVVVFAGISGKNIADSGFTIGCSVPANAKFTDTTYEVKDAQNRGTEESIVTTGEKWTWNSKQDKLVFTSNDYNTDNPVVLKRYVDENCLHATVLVVNSKEVTTTSDFDSAVMAALGATGVINGITGGAVENPNM